MGPVSQKDLWLRPKFSVDCKSLQNWQFCWTSWHKNIFLNSSWKYQNNSQINLNKKNNEQNQILVIVASPFVTWAPGYHNENYLWGKKLTIGSKLVKIGQRKWNIHSQKKKNIGYCKEFKGRNIININFIFKLILSVINNIQIYLENLGSVLLNNLRLRPKLNFADYFLNCIIF
jgi:hypothetical protein